MTRLRLKPFISFFVLLFFLSACSGDAGKEIKKQYLFVKLSGVQVQFTSDPTFSLGEQIKWNSGLKEIIYTEHGRLVKTEKFTKGNLLFSYANAKDPLALGLLKKTTPLEWSRLVDWSDAEMGVTLDSTFSYVGEETIRLPRRTFSVDTKVFYEKVSVPLLSISYINKYWIEVDTGLVVKSEQYFNPQQPPIVLLAD